MGRDPDIKPVVTLQDMIRHCDGEAHRLRFSIDHGEQGRKMPDRHRQELVRQLHVLEAISRLLKRIQPAFPRVRQYLSQQKGGGK